MQSRDFAIGVLATTAAILTVGLALVHNAGPAYADGMTTTASTGTYLMAVGSFIQADEDLLYVIDTSTDRMIVYRFESGKRQIDLVQGIDLGEIRRASAPPPGRPQPGQPPTRRSSQPPTQPPAPQQPAQPPGQP